MDPARVSDYLSVEYPVDLDHDMEFYTEPGKRLTQLSPAKLPDLSTLDTHSSQPINLTTFTDKVSEETLFDEFIALVDGTQKADLRTTSSHSLTDFRKPHIISPNTELTSGPPTSNPEQEQENIIPGRNRRILSSSGPPNINIGCKTYTTSASHKQKYKNNPNPTTGEGSLLRQQLQGTLCSSQYKKAQENTTYNCVVCRNPLTAKCILGTCMKCDEVLCPRCGQELTAKCLMDMCSSQHRPTF